MAFKDFKDLPRRTASGKVLRDKAFNIAKNPKYNGYQCGLASVVQKFIDKRSSAGAIKSKIMQNLHPLDLATQQLTKKLQNRIIKKFNKQKVSILVL